MAVSPEAATGKPLRIPQIVRASARMPLLVVKFFKLRTTALWAAALA